MTFDRWAWWPLYVPIVILIVLTLIVTPRVNRLATTRVTIARLGDRIREYHRLHGRLPERLGDLRSSQKDDIATKDAWGREIAYSVRQDSTYTLVSLGEDGEPGGTEEDSDTVETFTIQSHGQPADKREPK